jgi:hypothetical protein
MRILHRIFNIQDDMISLGLDIYTIWRTWFIPTYRGGTYSLHLQYS